LEPRILEKGQTPMFSLCGKCVVVTGGGKGIGFGISAALARAGANVVITGRDAPALEAAADEIARRVGHRPLPIAGDITKVEIIGGTIDEALSAYGYIDGWINNAGGSDDSDVSTLLAITREQWDNVVDLNLKAAFFAAQAAARAMTRGGSIVNISSRSGSQPCPMTGAYGAAKAGIENITATAAVEWGHLGIRVNAIAPGVVVTDNMTMMGTPGRRQRQIETVPLQRLGTIDDIGPLAVYLVSDEASWVTGSVIPVTGGSRIPVGLLSYLRKVNKAIGNEEPAAQA
jgi:NAD(P)-dependent dehydrogenase (short-subunit alcohol dehydrogenase family)